MANVDKKEALINRIRKINDKDVLDEINLLLNLNLEETIYPINEDQEAEINEARKQIKNGEGLSSESIEKDFDEWLNK